jgi:hypothetical protein
LAQEIHANLARVADYRANGGFPRQRQINVGVALKFPKAPDQDCADKLVTNPVTSGQCPGRPHHVSAKAATT